MTTSESTASLADLRIAIDTLDGELIALLARRFEFTGAVGAWKAHLGHVAIDPVRQRDQAALWEAMAFRNGVPQDLVVAILALVTKEVAARHIAAGAKDNLQ